MVGKSGEGTIEMAKTDIHTVYKLKSGQRVPSVTTVLGILNKPALLNWAWQCGIEDKDYKAVRDNAADIGTLAHLMAIGFLAGKEVDTSEYSKQDIETAENCCLSFWEWSKVHKVDIVFCEKPLISELYKFGGTIDFYGSLDGEPTLLDIKTGKAIYDEMIYQVAAYYYLLRENAYPVKHIRIIRVSKTANETYEDRFIPQRTIELGYKVFLNCLDIYNIQRLLKH